MLDTFQIFCELCVSVVNFLSPLHELRPVRGIDHLPAVSGDLEAQGWWVLDTTELGVEDVVQAILARAGAEV